ncbi:MAG: hypothetical protein ACOYL6_02140 [Bacteriovoracaceae bacterium]
MKSRDQVQDFVLVLVKAGLKPVMQSFFKTKRIPFKTPETYIPNDRIKFILIDDHREDWETISKLYMTQEKGISIISLTPVVEIKRFLAVGGKAVISDSYFADRLGQIFTKRLFTGEMSLHMDEVFGGVFLKYKTLKVMNHNRSGHYCDIIAADAFEQEYNNVAVRGFLYNSIYYLSYLNQSGLAELPFDITYAQSNKYFTVQIVTTVKNFFLEYLINSFGDSNSLNPISYILKDNFHLAHAFDISYMEKGNALVMTAIWEKKTENDKAFASFSFNNVKAAKQIILELEEKIELAVASDLSTSQEENLKTKPLPGDHLKETEAVSGLFNNDQASSTSADVEDISDDFVSKILGLGQKTSDNTKIKGVTNTISEDIIQVAGLAEEKDLSATTISGSEEEEAKVKISGGHSNLPDELKMVKGKIEDVDKQVDIVHGNNETEDKHVEIVHGNNETEDKHVEIVHGNNETEDKHVEIVHGNNETEDKNFGIVHGNAEEENNLSTKIQGQEELLDNDVTIVKGKFEDPNDEITILNGKIEAMSNKISAKIQQGASEAEKKTIVKQHISELLNDELLRIKGSNDEKAKIDQLTSIILDKTGVNKDELKNLVFQAMKGSPPPIIVKGEANNYTESILIDKLKHKEDQVKQLKNTISYLKGQLAANAEASNKLTTIAAQNVQNTDNLIAEIGGKKEYQINQEETQSIISQMKSAKEADALRKLAEREKELVEIAKAHELNLRKRELEFHGKEITFARELEKLERGIKGKELILDKTKEGVKVLLEKKEKEIRALTSRLSTANTKINNTEEDPRIGQMKKENRDLTFEVSDLKKKLNIAANAASQTVDVKSFNEEVTRLKADHQRAINEKQAITNQSNSLKKETLILKNRILEMEHVIADAKKVPYGNSLNGKTQAVDDDSAKMRLDIQRVTNEKINLQTTLDKTAGVVTNLKQELAELKGKLREVESKPVTQTIASINSTTTSIASAAQEKSATADIEKNNTEFSKMVKERDHKILIQTEKMAELESKVASLLKEQEVLKSQSAESTKGKVGQLDSSNKKLASDLLKAQAMVADSKKELAKIKSENTGLKNQVDKMKLDLDKANAKKAA